jgi:hypothetical protein
MHGMSNIKNETPSVAQTTHALQAVQVWLILDNDDRPFTWKPKEFLVSILPCIAVM